MNRFFHSIAHGGLVRIDGGVTPTSSFSLSTQLICEVIKERVPCPSVVFLLHLALS